MPEMTSKEAIEILVARAEWAEKWAREFTGTTDGSYYADNAAALRLAVGALEREARRMAAMPWRCQHCALLDASCFGSNEECNGFEEREHE
jgi:hypothetical protein